MKLSATRLFRGISEEEIESRKKSLQAKKQKYKKGEVIIAEGSIK